MPVCWHRALDDVPDGPGHRRRQRILRRAAGQPGGEDAQTAGTSALVEHRRRRQARLRASRPTRCRCSTSCCRRPCATRRSARSSNGAPTPSRWSSAGRLARDGGAALVIDYGHAESAAGDTLQAVGGHAFADPLAAPGDVDLTAHVDFQALGARRRSAWARACSGRSTQAQFLRRLGIETRAAALKATARTRRSRRDRRRARAPDRRGPQPAWARCSRPPPSPIRSIGALPGFESTTREPMLQAADRCSRARPRIRHAFFTRDGGVSEGVYAEPQRRRRLERRAATRSPKTAPAWRPRLGVAPERLLTAYQIHSPDVVVADDAVDARERARAPTPSSRARRGSRSASRPPTAGRCCSPTPRRGVIGAAHAGWRGALTGVIEATVAAMEKLGAERARIVAALGPIIRQPNYEVGPEFVDALRRGRAGQRALLRAVASAPATPCSISPATSPTRVRRAGIATVRGPRRSAPMPSPSVSSATAARPIAASRIMAGISTPSRWPTRSAPRQCRSPDWTSRASQPLRCTAAVIAKRQEQDCGRRGVDAVALGRARAARGARRMLAAWRRVSGTVRLGARRLQSRRPPPPH